MNDREAEALASYPEVLNAGEVAEILRLDQRTVAAMAGQGTLPGFKVGAGPRARWRFDRRRIAAVQESAPQQPARPLPPLELKTYPDVLRTGEVAAILRMEAPTVAAMAVAGTLKGFKVGAGPKAQWRFHKRHLVDLIESTPPAQ
ncbi:helix-turn-helix domain-containing protein [Streptomyces chryseus]|uniref:helix-turn-helix domain-containing protein n=1 Tax=Streptomyces chryseus TaxID=68186 RepID=UPI00110FC095|nr:helix-turn-helix domain-containing protein [Streptomyces chryseus]GGX36636.1 hypothetical protein GCM10010353_59700 [Streptomyces chryseus]